MVPRNNKRETSGTHGAQLSLSALARVSYVELTENEAPHLFRGGGRGGRHGKTHASDSERLVQKRSFGVNDPSLRVSS